MNIVLHPVYHILGHVRDSLCLFLFVVVAFPLKLYEEAILF